MDGTKRDHFAEVIGKIIAQLKKGVVPWQQPWGFCEPAQNHFTGHRYRGINSLLMLLGEYKTPYFATIKQINEAGGCVKEGRKSTQVCHSPYLRPASSLCRSFPQKTDDVTTK